MNRWTKYALIALLSVGGEVLMDLVKDKCK